MAIPASAGDVSAQFALDVNALGNLKRQAKSDPKQALAAAAGQFEALFMQMLLKSMREALPQDGPLTSETSKTYTGMFDQQLAQQLAKKGIGVADMLVKQLSGVLPQAQGPASAPATVAPADRARSLIMPRAPAALPAPARPADVTSATTTPLSVRPVNRNATAQGVDAASGAGATPGTVASTVQAFIDKLRPYAEAAAQTLGVPVHYLIAQAGLETGWGKSLPRAADGATSHNLFGIKATAARKGGAVTAATTEYTAGQMEKTTASFRAYGSYQESFQDFANLLQKSRRYATALANTHDAGKYAAGLQQAGYATDPRYAEKLTRAIQTVARYASSPAVPQVMAGTADKRADLV